jgi:uncharacterized protein YbjT (DUF2867 family)
MILVTGAGGKTGRAMIKALSTFESVFAFVLRKEHVGIVEASGADRALLGDMRDRAALAAAMRGARAVYHICPNMHPDEVTMARVAIDAAREVGVELFVLHSVLHPQAEKMPHHWRKLRVEEMLLESGLTFAVLQPAPYMQNLLADRRSIVEAGILRVPYSVDVKFSFVDLADVAEAARIVLTEGGHAGATYTLAGTAPLSITEVAAIAARVLQRPVRAEREHVSDWRARARGLRPEALDDLVAMFEYYGRWGLAGNRNVLAWLLNREPVPLDTFFVRTLAELGARG